MRRDVFQAIAGPTRRAIFSLIALQAMTPNAIADHFDSKRQAVFKHIQVLAACQLVEQQHGRKIYYHFDASKRREAGRWLAQFRQLWETRFDQLDDVLTQLKSTNR